VGGSICPSISRGRTRTIHSSENQVVVDLVATLVVSRGLSPVAEAEAVPPLTPPLTFPPIGGNFKGFQVTFLCPLFLVLAVRVFACSGYVSFNYASCFHLAFSLTCGYLKWDFSS